MSCQELAGHVQRLQPDATPRDVARLCLLMVNHVHDTKALADSARLCEAWKDVAIRLQAATDQHSAMTEELEALAHCEPEDFTADQIWTLLRAIRVQSQILQLYVGTPRPPRAAVVSDDDDQADYA